VGEAFAVNGLAVRGSEHLTVVHRTDGLVELRSVGSERFTSPNLSGYKTPAADVGVVTPECFDDAYAYTGWRETDDHTWFINTTDTPTYSFTVAGAQDALVRGMTNILSARTDGGGFAPGNSPTGARGTFAGTTALRPNIAPTGGGSCTGRDGINVVGWESGGDYLAVTCTWFYLVTYEVSESDALYNTGFTWTNDPLTNCYLDYDLAAVATHEWGHTYGLDHVDEVRHPTMTMSPLIAPCDGSPRTLGRGDALGLYALY